MPHLTVEYSANLRQTADMPRLMRELAQVLNRERDGDKPVYPVGGVRVRAMACEDFCIGDGSLPDAAFVHATLRIGPGRSLETRKSTGDRLFEALKIHFAGEFEKRGLALSLVIDEFQPPGSWKQNNLHGRYRPPG